MKTTLEIPDPLYRKVKARTALRGETVKDFVARAVRRELEADHGSTRSAPHWIDLLPVLSKEAAADAAALVRSKDFRTVDAEMWQ